MPTSVFIAFLEGLQDGTGQGGGDNTRIDNWMMQIRWHFCQLDGFSLGLFLKISIVHYSEGL